MGKNKLTALEKHRETLSFINHCKHKLRKAVLQNSDKELIQVLVQCVYNMLQGIFIFILYFLNYIF